MICSSWGIFCQILTAELKCTRYAYSCCQSAFQPDFRLLPNPPLVQYPSRPRLSLKATSASIDLALSTQPGPNTPSVCFDIQSRSTHPRFATFNLTHVSSSHRCRSAYILQLKAQPRSSTRSRSQGHGLGSCEGRDQGQGRGQGHGHGNGQPRKARGQDNAVPACRNPAAAVYND